MGTQMMSIEEVGGAVGWDGMGWDGLGWDGMGWGGMWGLASDDVGVM